MRATGEEDGVFLLPVRCALHKAQGQCAIADKKRPEIGRRVLLRGVLRSSDIVLQRSLRIRWEPNMLALCLDSSVYVHFVLVCKINRNVALVTVCFTEACLVCDKGAVSLHDSLKVKMKRFLTQNKLN